MKMRKFLNRLFSRMVITCIIVVIQLLFSAFALYILQENYVYVSVVLRLLSFIAVLHILNTDSNPAVKLAWIIPVLIFPIFGGLTYILYGNILMPKRIGKYMDDTKKWDEDTSLYDGRDLKAEEIKGWHSYRLCKYVESYGPAGLFENTATKYYPIGRDFWPDFLADLKSAEKYIFLEYFIINKGEMWDEVHEVLKQKVKEGVEVRLIYDDIGSVFYVKKYYWKELEEEGIHCISFNQVIPMLFTVFNNRDHRKIASIDGKVAYTGGFNLSDEYINKVEILGTWKDDGVRMEGDAAWRFTVMFLQMWNSFRKDDEDIMRFMPERKNIPEADGYLQPYTDTPLDKETLGENIYMQMINDAKDYVYIFTPYLVVCNEMMTSLKLAAKRGVDVRIVTPAIPDKKMIFRITQSSYRELLKTGVKIYQYTPGFIHSKCVLADGNVASVGSVNMDNRSFYHHFECGVLIYDSSVIEDVKKDMDDTFALSEEITLEWCSKNLSRFGIVDALLRILSPLL